MNNPLYLYLHYLLQHHLHDFELMQRTTQTGQNYIFVPLQSAIAQIEHPKLGILNVVNTHLSCFSDLTVESSFSDIHFTAELVSDDLALKFHVYQNQVGQQCGFNSKNLGDESDAFPVEFRDVKEIFHEAIPFLRKIREDFSRFIETHQKAFTLETKLFRELVFLEEGELEPQIVSLQKILETIAILNIFNPSLFTKKQDHYQYILEEKLDFQAHQAAYEPTVAMVFPEARSLTPREIIKQERTIALISKTKENIYILKKVLDENPERVMRGAGGSNLQIHPFYHRKLLEVAELNDSLNEHLFQLEGMKLNSGQKLSLQHFDRQSNQLEHDIKDFMNKYFETMVLCNQLEDFSIVYQLIDQPKPAVIHHLLRHQSHEILILILKKFNISIFEPQFQTAPVTIFEHMLEHKNERCFSAILEQLHIDFLTDLPDGRPAGMLILDLHPVNSIRIKCFSETLQFNSKTFFIRIRERVLELLESQHPMSEKLLEIFRIIDIYTEGKGPRPTDPSRMMQKISDSHQSFFSGFTSQLEEKDFLREERFLRLIHQYDELSKRRFAKAKASRQLVSQAQVQSSFLNNFCSPSRKQRLETLMPGLTPDQVYSAMQLAYDVEVACDRVMDIDTELKKGAALPAKDVKKLCEEKEQLLERIRELREGPRGDKREVILRIANRYSSISMTEEEQSEMQSFFSLPIEEKPIEYYETLVGISPSDLELIRSVKTNLAIYCENLEPRFISVVVDCLDRLKEQVNIATLPEETQEQLAQFCIFSLKQMFH